MDNFEAVTVESSTIARVGYNNDNSDMVIEFKNGSQYLYEGVPRQKFEDMTKADSVGHYFAEEIRDQYEFTKIK